MDGAGWANNLTAIGIKGRQYREWPRVTRGIHAATLEYCSN
jgi:hypothetical protein